MSDQYTVGEMKTIIIPDPGAGNDFSYTVPAGVRLRVRGLAIKLTTDATVSDRRIVITVTDPDGGISQAEFMNAVQAASKTVNNVLGPGSRAATGPVGGILTAPIASEIVLTPGDVLESDIKNIQAGDTLTKIYLLVEAFILP